jgi:hypothetical protein
MSRTEWVLASVLFAASGLAACAAPVAHPNIVSCQTNENCDTGSRCIASACVENTPPVASFKWTGELTANSDVVLDGTASHDPDTGDSLTSYTWSISTTDAACAPPTVTDKTQTVTVRFGCAGHYTVKLTVADELGGQSAPATQTLEVTGSSVAALVEAGPAQIVGHLCTGTLLLCRPDPATIQLTASIKSASYQNVRWSVIPPAGRELGTNRRVIFSDATALQPTVALETDGVAISGDWNFKVELLDENGVAVSSAMTRVSIANRPPVFVDGPGTVVVDHQYDASSQLYTAYGSFAIQVSDPDGDPIVRTISAHHTGDGSASFAAVDEQGVVSLEVVARAAAELIGPSIGRTIVADASDVNGGAATTEFKVQVGNHVPTGPTATPAPAPHWYDRTLKQYASTVTFGPWADPDGDPLTFYVAPMQDCSPFSASDATMALYCSSAGPLAGFVGSRSAVVTALDPWTAAAPATLSFRITNRPPVANPPSLAPSVTCAGGGGSCTMSAITASAPKVASDPDGDPLDIVTTSQYATGSKCLLSLAEANQCTLSITHPAQFGTCGFSGSFPIAYTATDGVSSVAGTLSVNPVCKL